MPWVVAAEEMREQEMKVKVMYQLSDTPAEEKVKREGKCGIVDGPNGLLNGCRNHFLVMVKGRWGSWEALGIPDDTSMNSKVLTAGE